MVQPQSRQVEVQVGLRARLNKSAQHTAANAAGQAKSRTQFSCTRSVPRSPLVLGCGRDSSPYRPLGGTPVPTALLVARATRTMRRRRRAAPRGLSAPSRQCECRGRPTPEESTEWVTRRRRGSKPRRRSSSHSGNQVGEQPACRPAPCAGVGLADVVVPQLPVVAGISR